MYTHYIGGFMKYFLQTDIYFSRQFLDDINTYNIDIDVIMDVFNLGHITRQDDGHLSFLYKGKEVITCENGLHALKLVIHENFFEDSLDLNFIMKNDYELAMAA